jgi:hypothetical protein
MRLSRPAGTHLFVRLDLAVHLLQRLLNLVEPVHVPTRTTVLSPSPISYSLKCLQRSERTSAPVSAPSDATSVAAPPWAEQCHPRPDPTPLHIDSGPPQPSFIARHWVPIRWCIPPPVSALKLPYVPLLMASFLSRLAYSARYAQ